MAKVAKKKSGRHLLNRLSPKEVEKNKPGKYMDGGGLRLVVSETGSRTFAFVFQINKRRREMGLGTFPNISLAEARDRAAEARRLVKQGVDPIEAANQTKEAEQAARLRAEGGPTLAEATSKFLEVSKTGVTPKTRKAWAQQIRDYCGSIIDKPCEQIEAEDIFGIFDPLWHTRHELSKRLRYKIERVLSFAKTADAKGRYFPKAWVNPARWRDHLEHRYGRAVQREVEGHRYLRPEAAPAFIAKLHEKETTAALLLEFTALTALRSSEARLAKWEEFDLDAGTWAVPAARMKARAVHVVPLSPRALEIIAVMRLRCRKGPFVFEGQGAGKPLGHSAVRRTMARITSDATPHGWRATFKTWATESGIRDDVSEKAIAHKDTNRVRAAYNKADLLRMRRAALEAWADFLSSQPPSNVLPFKATAG